MKEERNNTGMENGFTPRRSNRVNLNTYYTIFLEIGLIVALLIFIIIMRLNIRPADQEEFVMDVQEEVVMEEIVQTRQEIKVPPPPRPPVPVAVPNHEIIEDIEINIDADLNFDIPLDTPPPPRPVQDEEQEEDEEVIFILVEQMPELIGGLESIQSKIRYPEIAKRAGISGRVIVQFVVSEQGEVLNPQVIRGIGGGCDEEALRVVSQATFKPGNQRGRPVKVQFTVPVVFILRD
jgi:periplasmic protein TonB